MDKSVKNGQSKIEPPMIEFKYYHRRLCYVEKLSTTHTRIRKRILGAKSTRKKQVVKSEKNWDLVKSNT